MPPSSTSFPGTRLASRRASAAPSAMASLAAQITRISGWLRSMSAVALFAGPRSQLAYWKLACSTSDSSPLSRCHPRNRARPAAD